MSENEYIPTNEIASSLGVKPATMIRSLCMNGHYLGMRPVKLPNKRLLWPRSDRDSLLTKSEK
jgi:hypothetical protein